ncbi:MAG: histidine kinase, partial [Pseudomonadota bacterium]|nr:histidine kinase [Pseudomonadota bacterium]
QVSLAPFYFVPILLTVAWFGAGAAVVVAVASVALRVVGDVLANGGAPLPLSSWWNTFSALLIFLFIVWVFADLLRLYRQQQQHVRERTAELLVAVEHRRLLEHELVEVSSNERNRMGQELHDDICQHLVGTTLAAQVLAQRLAQHDAALAGEAQAIVRLIEIGTGKTRQLARGLLLSSIEPSQLPEKLAELADDGARAGVPCSFRQAGDVQVADAGIAAQLYRIAQEGLRNALRHAGATRVEMSLVGDSQAICLMVEDDGHGLSPQRQSSGMGLPIMAHRAAYIGATLSVVPSSDSGTRLLCRLPVSAPAT